MKETEARISEPTRFEVSDWPGRREELRRDFELSVKPLFDRLDRWRRYSAAGIPMPENRKPEVLKTAA